MGPEKNIDWQNGEEKAENKTLLTLSELDRASHRLPEYFAGKGLEERFLYVWDTIKIYESSAITSNAGADGVCTLPLAPIGKQEKNGVNYYKYLKISSGFNIASGQYISAELLDEALSLGSLNRRGEPIGSGADSVEGGKINVRRFSCQKTKPKSQAIAAKLNQLAYCLEIYEEIRENLWHVADDDVDGAAGNNRRPARKPDAIDQAFNQLFKAG